MNGLPGSSKQFNPAFSVTPYESCCLRYLIIYQQRGITRNNDKMSALLIPPAVTFSICAGT